MVNDLHVAALALGKVYFITTSSHIWTPVFSQPDLPSLPRAILLHWPLTPREIPITINKKNVGNVNKMLQNIALIREVLQECTGESVMYAGSSSE